MKEEEAGTDIEEVKPEIEDMAVEGDARGGGVDCDPLVDGGGACVGPEARQIAQRAGPSVGVRSARQ